MKIALKTLSIIVKVITSIMAIIGVILTARVIILAKPAVDHVADVADEYDGDIDPDDEDQNNRIAIEAFRRALSDPRCKGRFVHAVDYCIGVFASFVANL